MKLRDGSCGCAFTGAALLGLLLLSACNLSCSSSHLQIFPTTREQDFRAWVDTMSGEDAITAANLIGGWERQNMGTHEGGSYFMWVGYLDAWGQDTNCVGRAVVALEALHRLGYTDFVYLQVQGEWAKDWHMVCTNGDLVLSNGDVAPLAARMEFREIAASINPDWRHYFVYNREHNLIEQGDNT